MNISLPVTSFIGGVGFGCLSPQDIVNLSVKRIQNEETFDTLLHPTPGGLYDLALGPLEKNTACATCHLEIHHCPGHVAHIELPVPVYHVTFIDQLIQLLRGRCVYCGNFRLSNLQINLFICRLRLLQYGLLQEAQEVRMIRVRNRGLQTVDEDASSMGREISDDDDDDRDISAEIIGLRNKFVKSAIKTAGVNSYSTTDTLGGVQSVAAERKAVIKDFLEGIAKTKECTRCFGISPALRKDKSSKIFRLSLSPSDSRKMAEKGYKARNPLVIALKARQVQLNEMNEDGVINKCNGANSDEHLSTSEEGEDTERLPNDDEIANGVILETLSSPSKQSKTTRGAKSGQQYINTQEVHASMVDLFEKEQEVLRLVYGSRFSTQDTAPLSADMFFIKNLLVPPSRYRPVAKFGEGQITEAEQNSLYKRILGQCTVLNQIRKEISNATLETAWRRRDFNDLQNAWVGLQDAVDSLLDSERNPIQVRGNQRNEEGIKQKLEKKEGLFRKNMMGKRVNFAARSVISPDPNIETNEIGVPPIFAKKLTYPEPVTNHNFYDLKEAVLNGVDKWPGAAAVENENGQVINLRTKNLEERLAIANQLLAPSNTRVTGARNKRVHRHLNNGDIVLMNRQPTLHKPSMMGHRARILPGEKTIRMHYANCNTYNADFDGDEMNMHFPQNEIARAEALQITDTDHQYLTATSGKPLRGLIQDHLSMGVWLTTRDSLFDLGDYQQLLYSCLRPEDHHINSDRIQLVTPALIKPKLMWTGKQIITTILKNITPFSHPGLTLLGMSQTSGDRWGEKSEEGTVIFQGGHLLCGILDKAHLGPTGGGFIHSVHEVYGHTVAGKLLGILGRLLTKLLHMRAFSCGIEDIVFTNSGNNVRRDKLRATKSIGLDIARKYVMLEYVDRKDDPELLTRLEDVLRDGGKHAGLDSVYNARTAQLSSDITKACLPTGLRKDFPHNQMQTMTTSGAKGSIVNANQISCNLGQQVLEGRRVPIMISGKTLPSFSPYETSVRSGGYVSDRFLSGVKPQEYFFHSMAGREGLIDTAVKTSRSGYLQRCLIKGMEGLKVEYDTSVRDSDGSMVQFLYGEDGLDVTKQKHLTDFKFLAENYLAVFAQLNVRNDFHKILNVKASRWQKKTMRKVRKSGDIGAMDPVLAVFNPGSTMGSTSETFASSLKEYCEKNPQKLFRQKKHKQIIDGAISKKTFASLLDMKYMKSVVDPGEAVGIIAGQSVGEPSTQMTLNTFHLAGHSAKNVTLGIPRLREILMTASARISTPSMTLFLNSEVMEETAEKFAKGISKLTLAEIIEHVSVTENMGKGIGYQRARIYKIRLDLFSSKDCRETYAIDIDDVLRTIELLLIPRLIKAIKREFKAKGNPQSSVAAPQVGTSVKTNAQMEESGLAETAENAIALEREREGGEDDENNDVEDDDATSNKQQLNRKGTVSYEDLDELAEGVANEGLPIGIDTDEVAEGEYSGSSHRMPAALENRRDEIRNDAVKARQDRIILKSPELTSFAFDDNDGLWCEFELEYDNNTAKIIMLNLVEAACHAAVIQFIPGIGVCSLSTERVVHPITKIGEDYPVILTEGVNFTAMHDYQDIINPHKIFTNDIAAALVFYGVEACRATIIRQLDSVFKGHSITVDNRHLNLIADMMTRGGAFNPFSRFGLRSEVSPFMKMSFETTVRFLRDAVLDGEWDNLKNPSARIVTGKVGNVGTGAFDVFTPTS